VTGFRQPCPLYGEQRCSVYPNHPLTCQVYQCDLLKKFLTLGTAMGGSMLFSLIGSWVFGREYSDRTVKDLLALPTSRSAIVLAKFVVIAGWSAALTIRGSHPGDNGNPRHCGCHADYFLRQRRARLFAGVAILAVSLAQVVGIIGYGEYFPWAIPGLYSQGENLGMVSYVIVILTSVIGIAGTLTLCLGTFII